MSLPELDTSLFYFINGGLRNSFFDLLMPFVTEKAALLFAPLFIWSLVKERRRALPVLAVSLAAAALADGVILKIVSAFRSAERQAEIVRAKLERGLSLDAILEVSAPPGYSEHHTGRAIDITTDGVPALELEFERTAAFRWLSANAALFGYSLSYPKDNPHGYAYEPWHWCHKP